MTIQEMQSYPLKMIANAAGGLLPSLAQEMKDTFHAAVLPSYGMTECMPISSPPANYALTKPGTSGVPVGPEVAILNTMTLLPLPIREEGPICVRGDPCFRGYGVLASESDPSASKPESFMKDGWFNTGTLLLLLLLPLACLLPSFPHARTVSYQWANEWNLVLYSCSEKTSISHGVFILMLCSLLLLDCR
jgi:acyl-CoA synthetase (AMP-forming)/AMP-acid ligase II